MPEQALVKNAADPKQVRNAGRKEKQARERELADLIALLETEPGRRFVWRVLGYCKLFSDVWDASSRIHFNAGMQHVGHWLLGEVTAANEEAFFLMMRENQARQRAELAEAEATQTKRAEERARNGDDE